MERLPETDSFSDQVIDEFDAVFRKLWLGSRTSLEVVAFYLSDGIIIIVLVFAARFVKTRIAKTQRVSRSAFLKSGGLDDFMLFNLAGDS